MGWVIIGSGVDLGDAFHACDMYKPARIDDGMMGWRGFLCLGGTEKGFSKVCFLIHAILPYLFAAPSYE
jgi:hypothetical protein